MEAVVDIRNLTRQNGFPAVIKKAIVRALKLCGARGDVEVSVTLAGNARMRALNKKWRKKDEATDVLSFGLWEAEGAKRRGEIVICIPVAQKQARELGISVARNLAILAAHGATHLAGIDHERSEKEHRLTMHIQDRVLNIV
ncbi:rRNA maturation RNase YbeY [Candidatus Azambacteria bacterium]|nr:rRNA maturation RNase YbeY [Candidatus Azambacteria bacterium]MBI3685294.1 rRNA maturation RNase YbeY [Candidatus Azambacteria bacterium]